MNRQILDTHILESTFYIIFRIVFIYFFFNFHVIVVVIPSFPVAWFQKGLLEPLCSPQSAVEAKGWSHVPTPGAFISPLGRKYGGLMKTKFIILNTPNTYRPRCDVYKKSCVREIKMYTCIFRQRYYIFFSKFKSCLQCT